MQAICQRSVSRGDLITLAPLPPAYNVDPFVTFLFVGDDDAQLNIVSSGGSGGKGGGHSLSLYNEEKSKNPYKQSLVREKDKNKDQNSKHRRKTHFHKNSSVYKMIG